MKMWLIITIAACMELCYSSFYLFPVGPGDVVLLIIVHVAVSILLGAFLWLAFKVNPGGTPARRGAMAIVISGILFRLTLVPHPVVGSDDIYRYLWDGKVTASGINPYAYLPTDPHLAHLATADLPGKVNHPELKSVYPALAQGFFYCSWLLVGESVAGLKLLIVALDALTIVLLWNFLLTAGGNPILIAVYAWSPLPVLYFGLDGHIDALGIPFLVLALSLLSTNRAIRGSVALGLSALAKLVPLMLVPLLLRHLRGYRRWVVFVIPVAMTAAGLLWYLAPSGGIDALKLFGEHWEFNGSLFSVVYFLADSNEIAHRVSAILIILYLAALTVVDRPLLEKIFWGFVGFILLSPVVHPWYLTWLAALLVLRWSPSVFVFLCLSVIANVVVYQYRAYGQWIDQPLLLLIEYMPVYVLLVREIARGEFLTSASKREIAQ